MKAWQRMTRRNKRREGHSTFTAWNNVVVKSVLPTFPCVTDTFGHMSIKNLARHFVEIKMLTFKFMKTQKDYNSWLSTKEEPTERTKLEEWYRLVLDSL